MNCTTCRYELSQCLDGRLPSGRRALVMQHASQCDACGTFWKELQHAQQLTLRLQRPRVSEDFREALWQRIQAGEGTPDAVFREPVPLLAKLRYALTGAAAAAAALLCVTWFGPKPEHAGLRPKASVEARSPDAGSNTVIVGNPAPNARVAFNQGLPPVDAAPMMSSAQRIGLNLVALEAAKQLDNRYASANLALRRIDDGRGEAIEDVLEDASDFQGLGELLLDMRDRERLVFTDAEVEADLRFAVHLLARSQHEPATMETVRQTVQPAFRRDRLTSMSRKISLVPLDRHEEMEALRRIKQLQPLIFDKLFAFVAYTDPRQLGLMAPGTTFFWEDECGEMIGAPRSEVEAGEKRWSIFRSLGDRQEHIELRIAIPGK